jgi:hypothetical protein
MSLMRDSARGTRQGAETEDRLAGYKANRLRREAMFEQAFKRMGLLEIEWVILGIVSADKVVDRGFLEV